MNNEEKLGYACAYTPVSLIHAAGFTPYRILPNIDCPDRAGQILHDNLCPHVRRILDRVMDDAVPPLAGYIFMNSCDAMRRLTDAISAVKKGKPSILVDLPVVKNRLTVAFFRDELERVAGFLESLGNTTLSHEKIMESAEMYNSISRQFSKLRTLMAKGKLKGGSVTLQRAYNHASTVPPEESVAYLESMIQGAVAAEDNSRVPLFLFGNVMPEPEAFELFEDSGARIITEDMCTGSRMFTIMEHDGDDIYLSLARGILGRRECARTFDTASPGKFAENIVAQAKESGAAGVVGYTAKFCDPYIARIPTVREALKREGMPFLLLEGDCTLRAIGQHRTRVEAFIEMMR